MILGLDISTSITGYSIVDFDGKVIEIGHWDTRNKNKFTDFYDKAHFIKNKLSELDYPIDHIFIEPALNMFMMGRSSSHTISTLTKINGIVSWFCYEEFGIKPEYIPAISARKKCGISIKKGVKANSPKKKDNHIGIYPNLKETNITINMGNKFATSYKNIY